MRARRARQGDFLGEQSGASAVEFAFAATIFATILAFTGNYGLALYSKFQMDRAVSTAANFTLLNSGRVNGADGAALATQLAGLLTSQSGSGSGLSVAIDLNNGPQAAFDAEGVVQVSGTPSGADACYCPTGGAGAIVWGAAVACGAPCPGGGGVSGGKFVEMSVSRSFTPLVPMPEIFPDMSNLVARTLVQVQ